MKNNKKKEEILMKKIRRELIFLLVFVMVLTSCAPASTDSEVSNTDNQQEDLIQNQENSQQDTEDTIDEVETDNTSAENGMNDDTVEEESTIIEEEPDLTSTQRNSINMLNYITVLTQQINESKESRIYLEAVQSSLQNDIYPNAVDTKTQSQINNLWRTIDGYRMIAVKRDRLDYIYEQNKAQALRQAIPNPLGLLSTVQSGGVLKTAISVIYMAADSASSYQAASTQADLKYLQDNWDLEDEEMKELSESQLNLLNYRFDLVRDNDFPGEWALTVDAVDDFVKWINEPNVASRIDWLKSNETTYREFRTYWLELAKSYYEHAEKYDNLESYKMCISSIEKYEDIATRIFIKDQDYAETLPMVILSAKETMESKDYVKAAEKYAKLICENCDKEEWALRYFVAQIYVDLYANTENEQYLSDAYEIVKENSNILARKQEELNEAYLAEVKLEEASEDATKREKKEVKEYNKLLEEKREVELPPVNEAFYLNCELLLALADELNLSQTAKKELDDIIHDGSAIFLTDALDARFWASESVDEFNEDDVEIEFDGKKIIIPATCVTERTAIIVVTADDKEITDWVVKEVERDGEECSDFMVTFTSKQGKEHKYTAGETVKVIVFPVEDNQDETIEFTFKAVEKKSLGIIKSVKLERMK